MIRCQPALGTYVEIQASISQQKMCEPTDALLTLAIDKAFEAIQRVQSSMSVFEASSDLSRLNAGEFLNKRGPVDPWLWNVLSLAKQINALSSAFNPCIDLRVNHPKKCNRDLKINAKVFGALDDVLLHENHCLQTRKPVHLNLGGIAKGAAVDHAIDVLKAHGVESGCVNAGGDLRVFGSKVQAIYLRHPGRPNTTFYAGDLQDGALATSGDYFARDSNLKTLHAGHLFNPHSGLPIATPNSYSVIAPSCAVADALTKVYAITRDPHHPALQHFSAHALEIAP